jgi:hypothetical protein
MARLTLRLPDFGEMFDGRKMRALVTAVENAFARVKVDATRPAYSVTGDTTLGASDEVVLVDTSGGSVTITLPEISNDMIVEKREFEVVKIDAANTLTIDCTGTDTIVGEPDAIVTVQWTALRVRATTGNWALI